MGVMIHKKEFYFIRHGQTDYNTSGSKVDHEDVSLNLMGLKQAQAVEPTIASFPIKSICCSPFKRAKETKEVISLQLKAMHYEIPELGECTLQIWKEMTACGANAYESVDMTVKTFMERVVRGINHALSYEGPVLVVSHGGIHWALCCLMGITEHKWIIDNCLPVHFFIGAEGEWKARKLITSDLPCQTRSL